MKKYFLLFVVCFVIFMPINSKASVINSGKCGDKASYSLDDKGKLIITGSGDIIDDFFKDNNNIKEVIIDYGIEGVGNCAFQDCKNLNSVSFSNSIRTIGYDAFAGCSSITEFVFPEGLVECGSFAFAGCTNLQSIYISKSFCMLGYNSFSGCSNLANIYYPQSESTWISIYGSTDFENKPSFHFNSNWGNNNLNNTTQMKIPENVGEYNGHKYSVFSFPHYDWDDAKHYCELLGGHLATISDENENNYLAEYLFWEGGTTYAYFGLTNKNTTGAWKWVEVNNPDYLNWADNEPQGQGNHFAQLTYRCYGSGGKWTTGAFTDNSCPFLCEWNVEDTSSNKHNHTLIKTNAQNATCTVAGNRAYWYCKGCDKYFSDAKGENVISKGSWIIPATGHKLVPVPSKDPTILAEGNYAYYTCSVCGKYFSDAAGANEIAKDSWIIPKLEEKADSTTQPPAPATPSVKEKVTISKKPSSLKVKVSKNKVTVSWKKLKKTKKTKKILKKIKGIQVQYSTYKKFNQNVINKKIGGNKTKVTFKPKKKATYYVRVRYYGKDCVSKWSKIRKVKIN